MPHQCTNCGRTFADGSKEMLSGCPDCGGNKFQFAPKGRLERADADDSNADAAARGASPDVSATDPDAPAKREREGETPAPEGADAEGGSEDAAQAEARSEVVSSDDLPPRSTRPEGEGSPDGDRSSAVGDGPPEGGRVVSEPDGTEPPSIEQLREELDQQFESIKIVQPGRYELNLMELYDREEYIVSLQEDGRYVIDVPDSWREADDE